MYITKTEQEKRDLIVSDIYNSMFVEAGAGAGKSTLIVKRIVNQLKNGMKPGEIVAITFTNAATRELKNRIVKATLQEMKNPVLTDEEKKTMKTALDELDQMQISTIHSFCNRMLKEKCLDVQLSVDVQLMDENELMHQKEEGFILWAEGLKKSDWDILLQPEKTRRSALEKLKLLTSQLLNIPNDMEVKTSPSNMDAKKYQTELQRVITAFHSELITAWNNVFSTENEAITAITDLSDEWLYAAGQKFKDHYSKNDYEECMKDLKELKEFKLTKIPNKAYYYKFFPEPGEIIDGKKVTKKEIDTRAGEKKKEYDEKNKQLSNSTNIHFLKCIGEINSIKEEFTYYQYVRYVPYAIEARDFILNRLGTEMLTNNLLIEKTYELLKSSKEARTYFASKFKCIYVDEYQDTDHIQDAFIRLLSEDCETGDLRPGALFVVGDPKQSIYRFRGAEPEVYFQTKDYFAGLNDAYVIELQNNYRSNQFIIEWVNEQFKNKNITAGIPYVSMNVSKVLDKSILDEKTIYGIYMNKSPYDILENSSVGDEPEEIVKLIVNLVDGDYQIIDYDEQNNPVKRKITYKDFLILCRDTIGMDRYADVFRANQIPFVMDSKVQIKEEWCLQVFARVFIYLSDPFDRHHSEAAREGLVSLGLSYEEADFMLKKLLAATGINSYIDNSIVKLETEDVLTKTPAEETAGMPAEDIVETSAEETTEIEMSVKSDEEESSKAETEDESTITSEIIEDMVMKLSEPHKMSAIGILRFLEQNFQIFLKLKTTITDTEVLQIQTRITQMVEYVLNTAGSSGALMDAISTYLDGKIEHELILEDDVNAIRFMNLHKAKGLEGNIVVWMNRRESAVLKNDPYRKNGEFYPSMSFQKPKFRWSGVYNDNKLTEALQGDFQAEKIRLEYVAATRAKQAFIIMDKYNEEVLFGKDYDFKDRSVQNIIESCELKGKVKTPVTREYGKLGTKSFAELDLAKPMYLSETPSRLEDESAGKVSGSAAPSELCGGLRRPVGAIFGIVMHRTFELLVNRITYTKEFLDAYLQREAKQIVEACAVQAINENISTIPETELKDYKLYLGKMAMAFGKWWYAEKMSDTIEEVYTELPFSYFDTDEAYGEKIWWHGIADLVLKRKDGTVLIIDYKSDSDAAYPDEQSFCERLKGKYSPQITMYKEAVSKSLGVNKDIIFGMLISFTQKEVPAGEEIRVRTTMV